MRRLPRLIRFNLSHRGGASHRVGMYDLERMVKRLSKPWWGPLPPSSYVTVVPFGALAGQRVGVGLLALDDNFNYGAWNLTLLQRGTFKNPTQYPDCVKLIALYCKCIEMAAVSLQNGYLVGDIVTMHPLQEFHAWAAVNLLIQPDLRDVWLRQTAKLLEAEKTCS